MNCSIHWAQLLALVAVCLCVLVPPVRAQECLQEVGWLTDRPADRVAASSGYVYFSDGPTLVVADVSNPAQPTQMGEVALPHEVTDMVASGAFVYVVGGYPDTGLDTGLHIIDVADPANPTLMSFHFTLGEALAVDISGNHAYVADGQFGLMVFDISNATSPVLVGAVGTPYYARDVAVSGGYAYVADSPDGFVGPSSLRVFSLDDPSSPVEVGVCASWRFDVIGLFPGHVFGVGFLGFDHQVIDVTVPESPIVVYSESFGGPEFGASGLEVDGLTAYVFIYTQGSGNYVSAYDLRDPTSPVGLGGPLSQGQGMDVASGYLFIGEGEDGLRVLTACSILVDGFESGDTSAWSATVP